MNHKKCKDCLSLVVLCFLLQDAMLSGMPPKILPKPTERTEENESRQMRLKQLGRVEEKEGDVEREECNALSELPPETLGVTNPQETLSIIIQNGIQGFVQTTAEIQVAGDLLERRDKIRDSLKTKYPDADWDSSAALEEQMHNNIRTVAEFRVAAQLRQESQEALASYQRSQHYQDKKHRRTVLAEEAIEKAKEALAEADEANENAHAAANQISIDLEEKKQIYDIAYKKWEATTTACETAIKKSKETWADINSKIQTELELTLKDAKNKEAFWNNQIDKIEIAVIQEAINKEKKQLELDRNELQKKIDQTNASGSENKATLQQQLDELTEKDQSLLEKEERLNQQRDELRELERDLQCSIDSALEMQKAAVLRNPLFIKRVAEEAKKKNLAKEEQRKKEAKQTVDKVMADRQAVVDAKKAEIAELSKKWIDPTKKGNACSSAVDKNPENWSYPAATDTRKILSDALEKTWNHLANFRMIDSAKEAMQHISFFEHENRTQKKYREMNKDARHYGSKERRDYIVNYNHESMCEAAKEAIESYTQWVISELNKVKKSETRISITESALFEKRFCSNNYGNIRLRESYINAFDNVWPGVIQNETDRKRRILELQSTTFEISDKSWDDFIKSPRITEADEYTPIIAGKKEQTVLNKYAVALAAEAKAQEDYARSIHKEASDASINNEHTRAAEGTWAAMIYQSVEAITEAVHDWEKISEAFVNSNTVAYRQLKNKNFNELANKPITEIEYKIVTRLLDRMFAIAEANLSAWKATWSDEFQKEEVAKARQYSECEMNKIATDQKIHQLGTTAEEAKKKYIKTLENAKFSIYNDSTKYDAALIDLNALKEDYMAFEKAKVSVIKLPDRSTLQLDVDRNHASNRVREMRTVVNSSNALLNQIINFCDEYLIALEQVKEAKAQFFKIHGNAIDSPNSKCKAKFDHNKRIQGVVTQAENRVTIIKNRLGELTEHKAHDASSAWNWAWRNIVNANYHLAMAEVELEVIVSKLAKVKNG